MGRQPGVSVVVIFLNAEKFIREAIESVLAQTYGNWELLLVDDGSTDGSTQIALQYVERYPGKVRYLEHADHQNRGMGASRNLGVQHARGRYIALLDSDDVWLPHKLEQQVAILDSHPEAGMVYGLSQYWHSWTGHPEDVERDSIPELGVQADTLFKPPALLTLLYPLGKAAAPCPSDLLLRRKMLERIGGFEESFIGIYHMYEDQAFLAKVYLREPVFVASQYWDRYRVHPEQCTSVVQEAGQYASVRLFFLNWLAEYLQEQRCRDYEVWKVLHRELSSLFNGLTAYVEATEVSLSAVDHEWLWGFHIDKPQPGQETDGHELEVMGWTLGRSSPAVAVELIHEGSVLRRVPLEERRPDVAAAYPGVSGAEDSGFRATLSVPATTELELGVRAVLGDQSRVPLGTIRALRRYRQGLESILGVDLVPRAELEELERRVQELTEERGRAE